MAETHQQLDNTIHITTPENIAFEFRLAGPFRRLPAFLIDTALRIGAFVLLSFVLSFALMMLGTTGFLGGVANWISSMAVAFMIVLWFVTSWFYGGIFESLWNGQTPGKRLLGIRVLSTDGKPINALQAVMRNVLREVDMMPMFLFEWHTIGDDKQEIWLPTFLFGLLSTMLTRRFQRLGDLVTGTIVVVEDKQWLAGVMKLDDPRAAQLADYIPADFVIPRTLSKTLATYVERRRTFTAARRREVARHLAEPLLKEFGMPADTSYDLLLCALYHRAFIADLGDGVRDLTAENEASTESNGLPPIQV